MKHIFGVKIFYIYTLKKSYERKCCRAFQIQ